MAARRGESRGGRPVKMGERAKIFAPSNVHYFFRKIFYLLPKFSDDVPTEDLFFALHPGFSGGFPGNFCPKIGENDLLHFWKQTPKREKAYLKMGENSVKIFKSRGISFPLVASSLLLTEKKIWKIYREIQITSRFAGSDGISCRWPDSILADTWFILHVVNSDLISTIERIKWSLISCAVFPSLFPLIYDIHWENLNCLLDQKLKRKVFLV